jgi:hypothetical protein
MKQFNITPQLYKWQGVGTGKVERYYGTVKFLNMSKALIDFLSLLTPGRTCYSITMRYNILHQASQKFRQNCHCPPPSTNLSQQLNRLFLVEKGGTEIDAHSRFPCSVVVNF